MQRLTHLVAVALVLGAAPASAQDVHGVVHQQLVALLNPMGAEHALQVGLRAPLGDQDELLFDGAHAEAGVISYNSPVYAMGGGYLQVSPLSFLVLRAELTGAAVWPIGMEAAGYYGVDGYGARVSGQDLPADAGGSATGWSLRLSAQLQGAVPLWDDARLLIVNRQSWEHATLGDAPFYYSMKHDLVMAQQDWIVTNDALVLAEIPVASDINFTGGVFSNLRWIPRSGYVGHQVGPLVALSWSDVSDEVDSIAVFVRGGYYTHHVTRQDELTVLGGLSIDYDLGATQ